MGERGFARLFCCILFFNIDVFYCIHISLTCKIRRQLVKRIGFAVFCSETDQYTKSVPEIQGWWGTVVKWSFVYWNGVVGWSAVVGYGGGVGTRHGWVWWWCGDVA